MDNPALYYAPTLKEEVLRDGRTVWVAFNPVLPGVIAQGDTREQAAAEFLEMAKDAEAHLLRHGLPVPPKNGMRLRIRVSGGDELRPKLAPKPSEAARTAAGSLASSPGE